MRFLLTLIFFFTAATAFAADAAPRRIEIHDSWVRVLPADGSVTAYFEIDNPSPESDRLVSVSSPVAEKAALYRLRIKDLAPVNDPVPSLDVGGYKRIRLTPSDVHVKLVGVTRKLVVGDSIPLTLVFERSGRIEVTAKVTNQLLGNR